MICVQAWISAGLLASQTNSRLTYVMSTVFYSLSKLCLYWYFYFGRILFAFLMFSAKKKGKKNSIFNLISRKYQSQHRRLHFLYKLHDYPKRNFTKWKEEKKATVFQVKRVKKKKQKKKQLWCGILAVAQVLPLCSGVNIAVTIFCDVLGLLTKENRKS